MHNHDFHDDSANAEGGVPLQFRLDRVANLAAEARREGPLTDAAFAALVVADLLAYVAEASEYPLWVHLDRVRRHVAEPDGSQPVWHGLLPLPAEDLPLALAKDAEARADRLGLLVAAFEPTSGSEPDLMVTEALTDLWLWCQHVCVAAPDDLLPAAEVLHWVGTGRLH